MFSIEAFLKNTKTSRHWETIKIIPRHGIAIPLFSLRSETSSGVGEYLDLLEIADFLSLIPMNIIQLLPLNDCGKDPSPYNALSSCALDPIYLKLNALPHVENHPSLLEEISSFKTLNNSLRVDWKNVKKAKYQFFNHYFLLNFTKIQEKIEYQTFVAQNPWVLQYALYKVLKELYKDKKWWQFPKNHQSIDQEEFSKLLKKYRSRIDFFILLQYLCYTQLSLVKAYCENKGIVLKGDIPILLNPDSADVFWHRSLFNLEEQAGAPPDFYNPKGQNWRFPLFDWDQAKKHHFSWWKRRLNIASSFFHAYRIDHVVGFFRIWAIPKGKTASEGKFFPENPYLWPELGTELLEMMIDASLMLPIAEDLGTIPPFVFTILKELGILGTRVIRWEKYYDKDGSFIPIENYEPITLTTTSTHDAPPIKLWWKQYPEEAQSYATFKNWEFESDLSFENHKSILYDSHHTASFYHINPFQEYLTLFPELSHKKIEDERINIPGVENDTNWTYRFTKSTQFLINHHLLIQTMKEIVT